MNVAPAFICTGAEVDNYSGVPGGVVQGHSMAYSSRLMPCPPFFFDRGGH